MRAMNGETPGMDRFQAFQRGDAGIPLQARMELAVGHLDAGDMPGSLSSHSPEAPLRCICHWTVKNIRGTLPFQPALRDVV